MLLSLETTWKYPPGSLAACIPTSQATRKSGESFASMGVRISSCLLGQPLNLVALPLPQVRLTGADDEMNDNRPAPDPGKAPACFCLLVVDEDVAGSWHVRWTHRAWTGVRPAVEGISVGRWRRFRVSRVPVRASMIGNPAGPRVAWSHLLPPKLRRPPGFPATIKPWPNAGNRRTRSGF